MNVEPYERALVTVSDGFIEALLDTIPCKGEESRILCFEPKMLHQNSCAGC